MTLGIAEVSRRNAPRILRLKVCLAFSNYSVAQTTDLRLLQVVISAPNAGSAVIGANRAVANASPKDLNVVAWESDTDSRVVLLLEANMLARQCMMFSKGTYPLVCFHRSRFFNSSSDIIFRSNESLPTIIQDDTQDDFQDACLILSDDPISPSVTSESSDPEQHPQEPICDAIYPISYSQDVEVSNMWTTSSYSSISGRFDVIDCWQVFSLGYRKTFKPLRALKLQANLR